ncbi:hypothetical protein EUX98_g2145 [Antrodiella citrinella]|uniref:Uncharacterized protein n=1 Tax=Antrodiella citrinella TaxID=2447956 RepID=A0A4S4MZQ2_9APHY|nr:hypothetical protein EUX98_g2145 [Antrodiella citrinella]
MPAEVSDFGAAVRINESVALAFSEQLYSTGKTSRTYAMQIPMNDTLAVKIRQSLSNLVQLIRDGLVTIVARYHGEKTYPSVHVFVELGTIQFSTLLQHISVTAKTSVRHLGIGRMYS